MTMTSCHVTAVSSLSKQLREGNVVLKNYLMPVLNIQSGSVYIPPWTGTALGPSENLACMYQVQDLVPGPGPRAKLQGEWSLRLQVHRAQSPPKHPCPPSSSHWRSSLRGRSQAEV